MIRSGCRPRNGAGSVLCLLGVSFVVCTGDYNPFGDTANARMVVTAQGFAEGGEVEIFSTNTLQLAAAVRERIDSFTVHADSNRFFTDTTIADPGNLHYRFSISFTDTGRLEVRITTYRSGGDATRRVLSVRAVSPLKQDPVQGYFGERIELATDSVADKDVTYNWSFGRTTTVQSFSARTSDTIYTADNEQGIGYLWVSDGHRSSPLVPFTFAFDDTGGPLIEWANEHSGDTLVTADTEFPFKVRVTDRGGGGVHYVSVADSLVQGNRNQIYTRLFAGLDAYPQTNPLAVIVHAVDNLEFGNAARDTFWIAWDRSGSTSAKTDLVIANVERDTVVSRTPRYRMFGTVVDYAGRTVVVSLTVNGTTGGDTVMATGTGDWDWAFALSGAVNAIAVSARDTGGTVLASREVTIIHDPTAVDTTAPVIISLTASGNEGGIVQTADTAALVNVVAFDAQSGIAGASIGATPVVSRDGRSWQKSITPIGHATGTLVPVRVVDSLGNARDTAITVQRNREPQIATAPALPYPALTDTTYRTRVVTSDADGDTVRVIVRHKPPGMTVEANGMILWQTTASAAGTGSLVVLLHDGIVFTEPVTWPTAVVARGNLPGAVRFATTPSAFPAYLEAGADTLRVTLRVVPGSGKAPYRFSGRTTKPSVALLDSTVDSILTWRPHLADTGHRVIEAFVRDFYRTSDTLRAGVRVVPPNSPCSLSVSMSGPTVPGGALDLSRSMDPETLSVRVHDPDLVYGAPAERHRVVLLQGGASRELAVDTTGLVLVVLSPAAADSGFDTVRVAVSDRKGSTDTMRIAVYYGAPPNAPVLVSPADSALVVDTNVVLLWRCSDPDGNPLAYDVYAGPGGAMTRIATGVADTACTARGLVTSGAYFWQVVASDLKTTRASAVRLINVRNPDHVRFATAAEDFPSFVEAGRALSIALQVEPGTGKVPLSFAAEHVEKGTPLLSGPSDTTLSWTPTLADTGYRHIRAAVRDAWGNGDSLRATILVVPANGNPCSLVVSHTGPLTATGAVQMAGTPTAPDTTRFTIVDADHPLTESYTVRIADSRTATVQTIDTMRTFELVVRPDPAKRGYETIRVTVTDRGGTTATHDVVVWYGETAVVGPPGGVATGLSLWVRADSGVVTSAGALVDTMRDLSGNANHLCTHVERGTGKPGYVSSVPSLAGKPGIRFNGDTSSAALWATRNTGIDFSRDPYTVFIAKSSDNAARNGVLFMGNGRARLRESGFDYRSGAVYPFTGVDQAVLTVRQNGSLTVHQNGVAVIEQASPPRLLAAGTEFVLGLGSTGGQLGFTGHIAEVIVYDRALSNAERTAVEAYLEAKYTPSNATPGVKRVRISTSAIDSLRADVYNIPILVRLDAANFDFTGLPSTNPPLRFTKQNGQAVPYEIDLWSPASQSAAIWVLVDTVRDNNSTQYVNLHVDSVPKATSNGAGVFRTADGFRGVWHMNPVFDGGWKVRDATANGNHGALYDTQGPETVATPAGGSVVFDSASTYVDCGSAASLALAGGQFTLEAWVRLAVGSAGGKYMDVVSRGNHSYILQKSSSTPNFQGVIFDGTQFTAHRTRGISVDVWYHLAYTYDGSTATVYLDGTVGQFGTVAVLQTAGDAVWIGRNSELGDRYFDGTIDEVRISEVARPRDWIVLSHANQRSGSTVVVVE